MKTVIVIAALALAAPASAHTVKPCYLSAAFGLIKLPCSGPGLPNLEGGSSSVSSGGRIVPTPDPDHPGKPGKDKGNASGNNGKGGNYDRTGHGDNGKGKGRGAHAESSMTPPAPKS